MDTEEDRVGMGAAGHLRHWQPGAGRPGLGDRHTLRWSAAIGALAFATAPVSAQTAAPAAGAAGQAAPVSTGQPQGPVGQPLGPAGQPQGPVGQPLGPDGQPAAPLGQPVAPIGQPIVGPLDQIPLPVGVPPAASPAASDPLPPALTAGRPISELPLAPGLVDPDPGRIFGDDLPDPSGFGIIAALGLTVSARVNAEYSDNILRQSDVSPNRTQSRSDWRFQPQVSVQAGRPLGRQLLFVESALGYDFYARNSNLDRARFRVDGGLQWTLGTRCGGRVQAGWATRSTQFDQFEEVIASVQKRLTALASASCRSAVGFSPHLAYSYGKVTNSPDSRSFADSRSHSIQGGVGYVLGGRGEVGVQGSWSDSVQPNQNFGPLGTGGSRIWSIRGYGNYRLGPVFVADASLGHTKADPKNDLAQGFSGLTWQLGTRYSGPRIGAVASVGRSVSGGSGGLSNLQVSKRYLFSVNYRANQRLGAHAGFSKADIENRDLNSIPGSARLSNYTLDRLTVGADFRFNRIFGSSLSYTYQRRDANLDIYNYKANSIALSVRARF